MLQIGVYAPNWSISDQSICSGLEYMLRIGVYALDRSICSRTDIENMVGNYFGFRRTALAILLMIELLRPKHSNYSARATRTTVVVRVSEHDITVLRVVVRTQYVIVGAEGWYIWMLDCCRSIMWTPPTTTVPIGPLRSHWNCHPSTWTTDCIFESAHGLHQDYGPRTRTTEYNFIWMA